MEEKRKEKGEIAPEKEQEKEQPLELVESQGYIHYRKGAVVMFALQDYIGEDKVNQALQQCIQDWAYKEGPYITSADLLDYFRNYALNSAGRSLTSSFSPENKNFFFIFYD